MPGWGGKHVVWGGTLALWGDEEPPSIPPPIRFVIPAEQLRLTVSGETLRLVVPAEPVRLEAT